MNTPNIVICAAAAIVSIAVSHGDSALAGDGAVTFTDADGDAALRRTDPSLAGPLPASIPDILSLTVGGWTTPTPTTNPYSGAWDTSDAPNILRVDLVLSGLVNPMGTVYPGNPTRFGQRPLIAFVELDVDNDPDTGGECDTGILRTRYLANVARFGALPFGELGERAARNAADIDDEFLSLPQTERTGGDFLLSLCGCFSTTVVSTANDPTPNTFDAGDTWVVRGRFFKRTGGYVEPSAIFGGSAPGEFDPQVNLQYRHTADANRTTVSLVFPITMAGAAALTGQPEQAPDTSLWNHTSLEEALLDIVDSVNFVTDECAEELIRRWSEEDLQPAMTPSTWNAYAVVGTPYLTAQGFPYAYTDAGFNEHVADLNADGVVGAEDKAEFNAWLAENDGAANDADGAVNGAFAVGGFGPNFQLHDFTNNGVVDAQDAAVFPMSTPCPGDTNGDNVVNFADLNTVLGQFGSTGPGLSGDVNGDGAVNFSDFNIVLERQGTSCG